jgi:hypothetical protein
VTLFVPVVLTQDEAEAVANAAAFVFSQVAGAIGPEHPVYTGAIKIEDAPHNAQSVQGSADTRGDSRASEST